MPTKVKPVCAGCGKPADPVLDRTAQKGVLLHHECSVALTQANGWTRFGKGERASQPRA